MAQDLTVTRMGYGAMQLAGPHVFGPPADRDEALAVLREAVALGITHIDTADFYGPYITNQIIKEALHPYPDSLHIVTKVGRLRDAENRLFPALTPEQLRQAVFDNLDHLRLDVLDVVNLRVGGAGGRRVGTACRSDRLARCIAGGHRLEDAEFRARHDRPRAVEGDLRLHQRPRDQVCLQGHRLKEVLAQRQQVIRIEAALTQLNEERNKIHAEQKRIRENLGALGDRASEKQLRERFIATLDKQEDRLTKITEEEEKLRADRDAARDKLNDLLAKLEYEADVAE